MRPIFIAISKKLTKNAKLAAFMPLARHETILTASIICDSATGKAAANIADVWSVR